MKKRTLLFSWFLTMLLCMIGTNPAWADTSTLTFTKACGGSGTASDGAKWTVTSDASESTFVASSGIHYGTGKAAVSYLTLTTSDIPGTISKIVVSANGASSTSAKLNVKVGGSAFGEQKSLTSSSAEYTFTGTASGTIEVKLSQTSAKKALYCLSIVVTYSNTAVETVTVSPTSATIGVGGTVDLSATVSPDDAADKTITWSSNDTDIATVDSKTGVVTGVAAGEVDIIATSSNGKTGKCELTVTAAVPVTSVTLNKTATTLLVDQTETLTATIAPDDATVKTVTWTSSDETVATVEDGVVTAKKVGTATITATSNNGKTATCDVTVNPVVETGIAMNKTAANVKIGKTETLSVTFTPSNTTNKTITWTTSDPAVATVAGGVVTAVAAGTATITATSANSKTATCTITVITAGDGTLAKPYDVAEALDIISDYDDKGMSATEVYVKGIVSSKGSVSSNVLSYYISDDGTTTSQLQVYKGKYVGNYNFTDDSDLLVGDEVIVYGKLYKYVTSGSVVTPEINSGSYIYLLNGKKYNAITFAAGEGGSMSVKDEDDDAVTSGDEYFGGSVFTVTAVPNTGYSFANWTSDKGSFANATSATTTFTLPDADDAAITANFTLNTHALDVSGANGTYTTTVNGSAWNGSDEIPYGATVSITATPNDGYAFSEWDAVGVTPANAKANPLVFTMPDDDVMVEASYLDANIEYTVTLNQNPGGTIASDKAKAKAGETVTLTATPAANYVFGAWTVLDSDAAEVTVTDNKFTMPASAVEVEASFIRQYTVTTNVAGETTNVKRNNGATLSLDAPSAIGEWEFAGWSSSNDVANPVFVSNTATVTADMTLYAVWTVQAGPTEYRKVTSGSVESGEYLIVYEGDNAAFNGSLTKLDDASNFVTVTINDGKITPTDEIDAATFTIDATAKTIKSASGYYIGQTSNANGFASDKTTTYENTMSIDNGDAVIVSGGAYLRFNSASNQNRFRYYKSSSYTGQKAIQLYKKVTGTPIYTMGAKESVHVSAAGYATYSSDKALDFSQTAGMKAYLVTSDGASTGYTQVTQTPANTGLLLKAAEDDYNVYIVSTSNTDVSSNKMVGVNTATAITATADGKTNFVLQKGSQGTGFYKVTTAGFTVRAKSAYLSVALSGGAREHSFFTLPDDGQTTGISAVENSDSNVQNGKVYDLQGRQVSSPKRGLYIVNGKKVVVK